MHESHQEEHSKQWGHQRQNYSFAPFILGKHHKCLNKCRFFVNILLIMSASIFLVFPINTSRVTVVQW